MERIVDVDADPAVQMLRRHRDALAAVGRPVFRDADDVVASAPPASRSIASRVAIRITSRSM